MKRPYLAALAAALAAAFVAGCPQPPGPVRFARSAGPVKLSYDDLAAVLAEVVEDGGRVRPSGLKAALPRLNRQLKLLFMAGPTETPEQLPTAEDRLAYWYNARAAWALKLAAECSCPAEPAAAQFDAREFAIDGRLMTMEQIGELLAADRDWRTAVVAPCLCLGGARLPREPFSAGDVRRRIAERFSEYMDDEDRVRIDVERERVLIPPALWRVRERLISEHNATYGTTGATLTTALLPYVRGSAQRRLQDAVGYRCVRAARRRTLALVEED